MHRIQTAGFVLTALVVAGTVFGPISNAIAAQAKVSSIVIDAETGQVLEEHNADVQNYPASLTKMMTLYITFQGVESGRLKLDQELPVSLHAATRAPSKLNLVAGETVALRDLILGVVTKSANDAATVLAEGQASGSEAAFAEKMTQTARQLGMRNTYFHNASGLPDPLQKTTARDLSILARALYRDFPKEYRYFATREFTFRGQTMANHNHLMSSFQGMDGIKTGYIRASGFNLAASAVRDNRRLIGVVMGGESTRSRDTHMAALLNDAFDQRRSDMMVAKNDAPQEQDAPEQPSVASRAVSALSPVGRAVAAPVAPRHAVVLSSAAERWSVQLGAFSKRAAAEKAVATAAAKLPGRGKVAEVVPPGRLDKERLYRARLVNFTKKDAAAACRVLHRRHMTCSVVAPQATNLASN
ncbi:MAG: D-alanyl-D-alanine carboxypeptidase [Rhodospirillales bacterium]|nr:D-alanyl-D-alanine carboxypeptidase [Rhodospirillales bacterium]